MTLHSNRHKNKINKIKNICPSLTFMEIKMSSVHCSITVRHLCRCESSLSYSTELFMVIYTIKVHTHQLSHTESYAGHLLQWIKWS